MAPSISRPLPLQMQKDQSAQASVVVTSTTATGSCMIEGDSTRTLKKAGASRRSATSKHDRSGRTTPSQPAYMGASSASNRKRGRQDASDENADQKPRVRQRLISKASVETIRASTMYAHAPTHKTTTEADGAHSPSRRPLLREPSARNLRATGSQPLAESSSVNMQSASPRTLRRVGTFSFSSLDKRAIFDDEEERQRTYAPSRSRIPVPTSRASTPEARQLQRRHSEVDLSMIFERPPRQMQQPKPCFTKDPRETLVEEAVLRKISRPLPAVPQTTSPSTRAGLDRFDLKLALMDKHVELWDQSDDATYPWQGLLVLTDRQDATSMPTCEPPHIRFNLECHTHSYEGRFSAESNDLPVFSATCTGAWVARGAPVSPVDPQGGIIVECGWRTNARGQWYTKFWVPVPLALFRKRETRMFKVKATASVVDDRTMRSVRLCSGVVFADISHLRKNREMDKVDKARAEVVQRADRRSTL